MGEDKAWVVLRHAFQARLLLLEGSIDQALAARHHPVNFARGADPILAKTLVWRRIRPGWQPPKLFAFIPKSSTLGNLL